MKLAVHGPNLKLSKTEVRYATKFYMQILLEQYHIDEINLIVKFANRLHDNGYCSLLEYCDEDYPRDFLIEIDSSISKHLQLRTLAHELVHLKSFVIGELKYCDDDVIMWKKKRFRLADVNYWDLPSEIEAHGREPGLYYRYLDHKKSHKVKFS